MFKEQPVKALPESVDSGSRWTPNPASGGYVMLRREAAVTETPRLSLQRDNIVPISSSDRNHRSRVLLAGIDFGCHRTALQAAFPDVDQFYLNRLLPTVVGYRNEEPSESGAAGSSILYAEDALSSGGICQLVRPWANGAVEHPAAARDYLRFIRNLLHRPHLEEVRAVIALPSNADQDTRHAFRESIRGLLDRAVFLPRAYLTALGYRYQYPFSAPGEYSGTTQMIVDLGAGSTDLCIVGDGYPEDRDHVTLPFGGDHVDRVVQESLRQSHPQLRFSIEQIRAWKEQFGFVGKPVSPVVIQTTIMGEDRKVDLTGALQKGCEIWLMHILSAARELIQGQAESDRDVTEIVLCGGGSRIANLDTVLQEMLAAGGFSEGELKVETDSEKALTAIGALAAARKIREDQWDRIQYLF